MTGNKDVYTFIEISDEDVFRASERDFSERARALAEQGITHLIFNCCHWRWSYYPWWDKIDRALALMTEAAHRFGMKAVEHHSSLLLHTDGCPVSDWEAFRKKEEKGFFRGFTDFNRDPLSTVGGVRLSSMWQVNGGTGLPGSDAGYKTHVMCCSNPDFRRIYFNYLEHLYREVKIDGIMTDDIEIYSHDYCACEHCRKLFFEETGYPLPDPAHWEDFAGRFEDKVFVAWMKFRHASTKRFQDDVKRHYEALGFRMLRPNYVFRCLVSNTSCYPFEACADQWTAIFAENSFGIKTGYPVFAAEAIHRRALAQRTGVPVMSMFYPHLDCEYYFCYSLCWSWGQRFLGDSFSERTKKLEAPLKRFEELHFDALFGGEMKDDLAFWFSASTRDFCRESPAHFLARKKALNLSEDAAPIRSKLIFQTPFLSWLQAAYFSGFQTDMVFENDSPEVLDRHKTIIAPYAATVSEENEKKLFAFVERGGTLVTVGNFGEFDQSGAVRERFLSGFGIDAIFEPVFSTEERSLVFPDGKTVGGCRFDYVFRDVRPEQVVLTDDFSRPVALKKSIGSGQIICLAPGLTDGAVQEGILFFGVDGYAPGKPVEAPAPDLAVGIQLKTAGEFLKKIVSSPRVSVECEGYFILPSVKFSENGAAVRLINLTGTLVKENRPVTDYEELEFFNSEPEKIESPVSVTLSDCSLSSAVLYSPEMDGPLTLATSTEGGKLKIIVPAGSFSGFALIEISV
ncbi:MAG: beta-galactosidase trimerization domain-containing protein [Clostridia bacterium]|nr:beta-galactosidase trimerization domain-containing protein [Clostridia bacterium]